ncbi:IS5 family transposase [Streptomyces sp. NBC_01435]|uniref:IS5 family transposase n=1 Tax=Streptomyces sp. NBC_01435 TaxID=2903865 RepID=UPI002E36D104|nr:IS5 family transposase [Streptomyces sp. NBC_01435]
MSRHAWLNDRQWDRIQPLLPSGTGRRGRPWADHRRIVEAIVFRYRTGIPWRDLPARFGSWKTVWARYRRWAADGTWDRVLGVLLARADDDGLIDWRAAVDSTITRAHQHATNTRRPEKCRGAARGQGLDAHREPAGHAIGRSRGGLTTKIHHAVDGQGRPLAVVVTPGQAHDGQFLPLLLGDLRVSRSSRLRTTPTMLLGDKAYSSRTIRAALKARGITVVIPEGRDQPEHRRRGSAGGRPSKFDPVAYKNRNVVERSFALLKQWRGLVARFGKLAIVYRSAAVLAAVLVWARI